MADITAKISPENIDSIKAGLEASKSSQQHRGPNNFSDGNKGISTNVAAERAKAQMPNRPPTADITKKNEQQNEDALGEVFEPNPTEEERSFIHATQSENQSLKLRIRELEAERDQLLQAVAKINAQYTEDQIREIAASHLSGEVDTSSDWVRVVPAETISPTLGYKQTVDASTGKVIQSPNRVHLIKNQPIMIKRDDYIALKPTGVLLGHPKAAQSSLQGKMPVSKM
jgi:hypothetical protein